VLSTNSSRIESYLPSILGNVGSVGKNNLSLSDIAQKLFLQSNTLTPLLKRMEELGLLTRTRSKQDERSICISLTETGEKLKTQAEQVPSRLMQQISLTRDEAIQLHTLLYKLIQG
jgi:DNA-binding MarR family transcriptional regulator